MIATQSFMPNQLINCSKVMMDPMLYANRINSCSTHSSRKTAYNVNKHTSSRRDTNRVRHWAYTPANLQTYASQTEFMSAAIGHPAHYEKDPAICLKCDSCLYNLDKSKSMPACSKGHQHYLDDAPLWRLSEVLHPWSLSCVAIDCEMVWTTHGLELAHIVILNGFDGRYLASRYVKPRGEILDLLTTFSGIVDAHQITGQDALDFAELRPFLESLGLHARTFIIGHGLSNDLKAMRLFHKDYLIDTAILYAPIPSGRLPSLKTLAKTHLQVDMQRGNHNPHEDAWTAMRLVQQYKLHVR